MEMESQGGELGESGRRERERKEDCYMTVRRGDGLRG
jgi:hypothetical protein